MKKDILVAMASFPPRRAGLLRVVADILPQCDRLCLYLNGYDAVPEELTEVAKLTVVLAGDGKTHPDKGSQGKHYWLDECPGYYLTVDDDMFYPDDYTEKLVAAINRYGGSSIITVHGTTYRLDRSGRIPKHGLDRQYASYLPYTKACRRDTPVHVCGNACTGFVPSALGMTSAVSTGSLHSGDDGDIALFAQARQIPIVRMQSEEGWLLTNREICEIGAQYMNEQIARLQDAKTRSWKKPWYTFHPTPA